jgi:PPOX class probable F420-dependent enzyme
MGIRLSKDEAWEFLENAHTGILTTLRADGSPVTLPVWFVALDQTICFSTPSKTKKILRIRNDPRASFLVESGQYWVDLKAVHLTGLIQEVPDGELWGRIDKALSQKYDAFKTESQKMPEAVQDTYARSERILFQLVPSDRVLTWDNRRVSLRGQA